MKIRFDFVTNSSSSSFTCVALYSEELYEFLQKLITENKYKKQPSWGYLSPKDELHLDWRWEELKFDREFFKVQTTEEYGNTDKDSICNYISYFFNGLSADEEITLKDLVYKVYKNKEYQTHKYTDQTDGFVGFDFKGKLTIADKQSDYREEEIQKLIDVIKERAVDPNTEDLSMKSVSIDLYDIDGYGIFDPNSKRYSHIDKSFLNKVRAHWAGSGYTDEGKKELQLEAQKEKWGEYLRTLYKDSLDELGAIVLGRITSKCDYAVIMDSADGAVSKFEMDRYIGLNEENRQIIKENYYIHYLRDRINDLSQADKKSDEGKLPVKVIFESQLYDYLMKHTSLGGITPKPVYGPNGTIRCKVPECYKETIDDIVSELINRWPSREINPKTRTYESISKEIDGCYKEIGYESREAFFDAYGFSVKKDETRGNTSVAGDYEYTITKKGEVTIVKYKGNDTKAIVPSIIEEGIVRIIGTEAFVSNNTIEEVVIPDSVDTIRTKAFAFCNNLKKVHLPNTINKIVAGTFDGCGKLEEVNIPDMIGSIPLGLFRDCPIKTLYIGKSLSGVEKNDFYRGELVSDNVIDGYKKTCCLESITINTDNINLKCIDSMILSYDGKILYAMLGDDSHCRIPDGVEIIADYAFARQEHLVEIEFPDSLKVIGNHTFESTGLSTVTFPNGLRTIGVKAFHLCSKLSTLEFSESLETICDGAFSFTNVRSVVLPESLKTLGEFCFDSWEMRSIEPIKWEQKIKGLGGAFKSITNNTKQQIEKLEAESGVAYADSLIKENAIGYGLLFSMMTYLQSDIADTLDTSLRLRLEEIVISREMQSLLGTNLKYVLSQYKNKSTARCKECISYMKTESEKGDINELLIKIKTAFPTEEMDILLKSVTNLINKEA